MGQNPVLIDPNQLHYPKRFEWTKNEECVLKILFFSSKTRYVINSVYIHINRERELLQINEENNVPCMIPDFFKI